MKFLIFAVVISFYLILWACLDAAARADEQSQRMYDKGKNKKFEKE